MNDQSNSPNRIIKHDGIVHHPLGGGSYVFKSNFVDYLAESLYKDEVRVSIGAQPNSSPHFGTLAVSCLAFSLAQLLKPKKDKIEVFFEVIDTAPYETRVIDGIQYQIGLRESGEADEYLADYLDLFEYLKSQTNVQYNVRRQSEFNSQANIPRIVKRIIARRDEIASVLDPDYKLLRIRVACRECGLTDKKGVNNRYGNDFIESYCPNHGRFKTKIDEEPGRLEYNTPLRNLIRALVYSEDNQNEQIPFEWLRVTGGDYAGFYQEQLLYAAASILGYPAHELPKIIYTPLIVDWSGAKLSKSLYVKEGAYRDLPPYLVNFREFRKTLGEKGLERLLQETSLWLKEPYRLFRNYSVYYFMEMFGYDV